MPDLPPFTAERRIAISLLNDAGTRLRGCDDSDLTGEQESHLNAALSHIRDAVRHLDVAGWNA